MKIVNKIAIGFLTVFLAVSAAFNLKLKDKVDEGQNSVKSLENNLYELSTQYDSVRLANDSLYSLLDSKSYIIDSLQTLNEDSQSEIDWLNNKINGLKDKIDSITGDSVYLALQDIYECKNTLDVYKFSECEIKSMYETFLTLLIKDSIVIKQDSIITRQKNQINLSNQKIELLSSNLESKNILLSKLYRDLSNGTIQYDALKEEKEEIEKTLRLWKVGSIGAGSALILILLLI